MNPKNTKLLYKKIFLTLQIINNNYSKRSPSSTKYSVHMGYDGWHFVNKIFLFLCKNKDYESISEKGKYRTPDEPSSTLMREDLCFKYSDST